MSLLSWWNKRNGILKEEPILTFSAIEMMNTLIVTSGLKYETICDKIAQSFRPPINFRWRLMKMEAYQRKLGFYVYTFELEEKDGY
jgi:hypothetical protein